MASIPESFADLIQILDETRDRTLSLNQLEAMCAQLGLDLYFEDHLFIWLMDQLRHRGISLSDTEDDTPDTLADDPDWSSVEHIREDIEEIVSLQANEEDRLLNQAETLHLLRAVHEGMAAMEQLEQTPDAEDRETLELLIAKKSEAETTLLTRNRGLVRRISLQYQSALHSLTLPDLEQEGSMGFLRAISKFDLERTTLLSTYAVYWIRQAIQQAIANQDRTIRLPVHKRNEIRLYRIAVETLKGDLGREPTIREVALKLMEGHEEHREQAAYLQAGGPIRPIDREALHRMQENVKQLQGYSRQYPTSLDQFMEEDEPDRHEILTDENTPSPESQVLKDDLIGNVDQLVMDLPEPEQTVMRLRYGFGDRRPLKYTEIADVLNRNPDMRALNNNQDYTGHKVRGLESHARRTLTRQKSVSSLAPGV